ncbi:MAG: hypothetical protein WC441_03985 [Patescibacteria group bacterium]
MKKLLMISFLFLGLLFLSACSKNNNEAQELNSINNNPVNSISEINRDVDKNNNTEELLSSVSSNWPLFKNNDYLFEFKYPNNSLRTETLLGQKVIIPKWKNGAAVKEEVLSDKYSLKINSQNDAVETYYFNIMVYPNTDKKFEDVRNNVLCKPENIDVVCENIKIGNIVDAYKVTVNSTQAVPGSDYYFIYKGNYYIVQHSIKPTHGSNVNNFGEEIFKTLSLL